MFSIAQWFRVSLSSPPQGGVPDWRSPGWVPHLQTSNGGSSAYLFTSVWPFLWTLFSMTKQYFKHSSSASPSLSIWTSPSLLLSLCFLKSECWKEENERETETEWSGELYRIDSRCFFSNLSREVSVCVFYVDSHRIYLWKSVWRWHLPIYFIFYPSPLSVSMSPCPSVTLWWGVVIDTGVLGWTGIRYRCLALTGWIAQ